MSLHIVSNTKAYTATQTTKNENFKEKKKSFSLISFITNLFLKIFSSPLNCCGRSRRSATYHNPAEKTTIPDETSPLLQKDSKQEISPAAKAHNDMLIALAEVSSENRIDANDFQKIFSVFEKTISIKTDHDEIIRTTETGERLARPLMKTTAGKVFILFTKCNACSDELVGKGTDNSVKYAYNLNEKTIHAIGISKTKKTIDKAQEQLLRPIELMKKLGENNVPKVEGCVVEKNTKGVGTRRYTVMELYKSGALVIREDNVTKLAFQKLELKDSATEQMLQILAEFEKNGIVHSDIKLQNFVHDLSMSKDTAKVKVRAIDLDRSFGQTTQSKKSIGTVIFSAPEVLVDPKNQTSKADVYSMGLSLLQLWGYCNLPAFLSSYISHLSPEQKQKILQIHSKVNGVDVNSINDKTANKLYHYALMLCIVSWFKPDTNDALGQLLSRAVHPMSSMRPTAKEFHEEYVKIKESNIKYQRRESEKAMGNNFKKQPFQPEFDLNFKFVEQALRTKLATKEN